MHVDKNYSGNHRLDCEEFSVKHGLKEFVGFMTAVDIPKVLSYSKKGGVEVYATAGLSNLNEFGTINVCVVISGLTLNGMVNALMTATEAKAKIVYEKCGVTGTTSDAMGIFSRRGDIEWAGSATETGRDIERAVSEAVKESIKKWESLDES
jgi:adenosylcobinamide hydrolase